MSTSQSSAKVIETRYVWSPTVSDTMEKAHQMREFGWRVEGNPAPMTLYGNHGTGVAISREIGE